MSGESCELCGRAPDWSGVWCSCGIRHAVCRNCVEANGLGDFASLVREPRHLFLCPDTVKVAAAVMGRDDG